MPESVQLTHKTKAKVGQIGPIQGPKNAGLGVVYNAGERARVQGLN